MPENPKGKPHERGVVEGKMQKGAKERGENEKRVGNREVHVNFLAFNYLGCIARRITLKMCVYAYIPYCKKRLMPMHSHGLIFLFPNQFPYLLGTKPVNHIQ